MKRRIRWTALVLAVCLLALTGCAQQRDTMTLRERQHPGRSRRGQVLCRGG